MTAKSVDAAEQAVAETRQRLSHHLALLDRHYAFRPALNQGLQVLRTMRTTGHESMAPANATDGTAGSGLKLVLTLLGLGLGAATLAAERGDFDRAGAWLRQVLRGRANAVQPGPLPAPKA